MGNKAITVDRQIKRLQERGMMIVDVAKAEEVLLDIGYYRLGFYWFPFETSYPNKRNRIHLFKEGTNFDHIVKLYYFDFELKNILTKFIARIEINFRTFLTYSLSNEHENFPTWFVNPSVVDNGYIKGFESKVYAKLRRNPILEYHHKTHLNEQYAPAWKTIEFMTLGEVIYLYQALLSTESKRSIAKHFGLNNTITFESYLSVVLMVRNRCAHGNILYDIALPRSIRRGPAGISQAKDYQKLAGILRVLCYMIGCVSKNRQADCKNELIDLFSKYDGITQVHEVIKVGTGISNIRDVLAE